LGVVQRNAIKMNNLIDDLLHFSRLGKKELIKSEVDIEKVVQGVITDLGSSSPHKAQFKLHELPPIHADYSLLTQVWVNLISNAIKYSSKKENPSIEIGSLRKENEVVYYIKDNGAGFNMKYADKLFGVFQRFHKPTEFEGTGVGLALVHRIINRHGGTIWAESAVNEGATFYFSLPIH
jgi:two-component system sensor histidine kinase/response regulator